jgi:hypothetical protein
MVVALALMRTPNDPSRAGIILAQGTLSLVSHSASGFFGTLARVSASAGQAVAALSLDADYRNWHRNEVVVKTTNLGREWKKRGLHNTGKIIMRPFADLLIGVSGGVAGVVVQPIKGFRQDGTKGLLRGAAIGFIGLFAKPIVGILDSFAHFTASVHDIAKSVNLLEKRDDFPTRLRKSYSFGPLGVLATFNADVARAKQLLHEFPLRLSLKATFPAEIIIHVEFLPGAISYETALIATSHRVVVIQVREELAGYPVADLCWQGVYAVDLNVQSKLDDQRYGHGASLCLMSKSGDTNSRTESSDDVLNEPKPGSSSKLAVSRGLSTPKEKQRSWKAPRESETNSGTDGSATKRFTIIAEYQFRQQLARFHNVVSCISGRFDDLLFEGPEDTPNNYVDGLTCFGMYLFDRPTAVAIMRDESVVKLDNVPWIPKSKIVEFSEKSPNEQKLLISTLQEHWTFSDEMEAARNEGGPSWFVEAKARSRFIEPVANQRSAKQSRTLSWAEHDEELSEYLELEDGTETNSFVPMPPSSLQEYATTHQRVEVDNNNEEEDEYLDDQFPAASDGVKFHSSRHSASRMSALSFQSPLRGSNNAMRRSSDFNASFATANSYYSPRSSDGPDRLRTSETTTSRDRLDRLEDMVEQLVLVATESTIRARRNEFQPPELRNHNNNNNNHNNSELVRLRQEVDELRAQINPDDGSSTTSAAAAHEMARLRSEVATLRAQLEQKVGGNTVSATTTREHLDLAENMSAEQVD